jgi:hypothetical protein
MIVRQAVGKIKPGEDIIVGLAVSRQECKAGYQKNEYLL